MNKSLELLQSFSELADDEIDYFIEILKLGIENEWDCGLDGLEKFGGREISIAAKNGLKWAKREKK